MSTKDVRAYYAAHNNTIDLTHGGSEGTVIQTLSLGPSKPDHRSFIISTWLKSYRTLARRQGIQDFYDKHEPAIAESRWEDCQVATDEDGYTVYAWICGSPVGLWHCYVIPELRMLGMSKALMWHACGTTTPDLARPWPYKTRSRVNNYLLKVKDG